MYDLKFKEDVKHLCCAIRNMKRPVLKCCRDEGKRDRCLYLCFPGVVFFFFMVAIACLCAGAVVRGTPEALHALLAAEKHYPGRNGENDG